MTTKRILLVDDDSFIRNIVRTILLKADSTLNIVEASNGEEAWKLAMHQEPDVAIIDVVMPVMDGETLSRKLRELYPNLPIIIMTGYNNPESKNRLVNQIGVDRYLDKSDGLERFYTVVNSLFK